MKDHLRALIADSSSPIHSRNTVREYLQARILRVLQLRGAMIPLAFHGGTALRFLFTIPRHSEDLDFALEHSNHEYDFSAYLEGIRQEFTREGYEISFKVSDRGVVQNAFVRFRGLLNELRLSPYEDETLTVKIEVDTRPPGGAVLETTTVRRHVILRLQHHDRASLLAGKIHALLQRRFTKGRDLFDLIWYLSDPEWSPPNLVLLNNALEQTGWGGPILKPENWKAAVRERLSQMDWKAARDDIAPFLEDPEQVDLVREDVLMELVS